MPHVSPNGCLAEKLRSDLDVVEAACHQDEHLVLAIGEGATRGVYARMQRTPFRE
jgi:hypothetical protein